MAGAKKKTFFFLEDECDVSDESSSPSRTPLCSNDDLSDFERWERAIGKEGSKAKQRPRVRESSTDEEQEVNDPTCGGFVVPDHYSSPDDDMVEYQNKIDRWLRERRERIQRERESQPSQTQSVQDGVDHIPTPTLAQLWGDPSLVEEPSGSNHPRRSLSPLGLPSAQLPFQQEQASDDEQESPRTPITSTPVEPLPGRQVGGRGFRLQGKRWLLTYKTQINKDRMKSFLKDKMPRGMKMETCEIAHEEGDPQTNYPHTHVVLSISGRGWDRRNAERFLDYQGIHPHLRHLNGAKALKDALTYIAKEDPELAHLQRQRTWVDTIIESTSALEAVREIAEKPSDVPGVIAAFKLKEPRVRPPKVVDPEGREWQRKLLEICDQEPDDRSIYWIYDEKGNTGKSSFSKFLKQHKCEGSEYSWLALSNIGKQQDNYHVIAEALKSGWNGWGAVVDLSRSYETSWSIYSTLEALKNGSITSTKYMGSTVNMAAPHVIVFANWWPNTTKLSLDRWKIYELLENYDWERRDHDYKEPRMEKHCPSCMCTNVNQPLILN
jgi:hypothetical protein